MMKERLHDTATGPLRGAARGPCATPSEPSPATLAPCQAPGLPVAAPGGLQGGAAGSSGSGAAAVPADGNTEMLAPGACGAARGQSSPEHASGGRGGKAPEPAAPQALAGAAAPVEVVPPSGAVPGAAGAPAARAAMHGTESALAAGGQSSEAAQPDATAGSAAGSLSGGAPEGSASLNLAAVPGLGIGQGQGWGGNLRAAGGSPKTSRAATLGENAPPLRKSPRMCSPMVPPACERAPAAAAEAKEAGAQQVLDWPGAQASQKGMPGNVLPPARQHAAMGISEQGLPCQPGAQAAAEGTVGRLMLPERPSAAGAAAAVGAVRAGASRDGTPLQSRGEMLPAGQSRAEPAAASAVEEPVRQEEGLPIGSEAAQAAAVEWQGPVGGLQGPSAGFEQPLAGRSVSAADVAARAAPGSTVVLGTEDPVGFHTGARDRADRRAAPGSSFDACSGWKQGQQGPRPAEAGATPYAQVHPAPRQRPTAPTGLGHDLRPGGSIAGRSSGIPIASGVVGCAPSMGPGGAPARAAVPQSIGGASGQRSGREAGTAGAGSPPGGRGASYFGARSAPNARGPAYMGTQGAPGGRSTVVMGTRRAVGGRECAAPAGAHDGALDGGFSPRFGPYARARFPGGARTRCEVRVPRAGSAPCTAGGPNPGQNPIANVYSRTWPHPRGSASQCALQGRAHGTPQGLRPACRCPAGQHRPSTAPGDAFYSHVDQCPGGLAACPGVMAAGAGRRGGAPGTFAEVDAALSKQLPGPPPIQQLRQHSAPVGGRPQAKPGVQGRAQARPPAAYSRSGVAGAARTRMGHEGPYPRPGPVPHSGWMCPPPAAQLEQVLLAEREAARWGQQEAGMPRAPCERRDGAAPGAPVLPKPQLHSRSGSSQPAGCRVPAMGPRPVGHAAARRSGGTCMAEADALERPATPALTAERAGITAPPDAGMTAAAVTPFQNERRTRRGARGADMAAPPAQALPVRGAKRVCSRTGGSGVPAAAAGAADAHQAGRCSFRADRAGTGGALGHAPRAREAGRARVSPHDAGVAKVAMHTLPVPRAKRACSRPEAPGPRASTGQNSTRAAGVGGAAPGACGHGRELDQAGEPDQAPPGVSPTIARLVEQVLLRISLAEEPGQLIHCI